MSRQASTAALFHSYLTGLWCRCNDSMLSADARGVWEQASPYTTTSNSIAIWLVVLVICSVAFSVVFEIFVSDTTKVCLVPRCHLAL